MKRTHTSTTNSESAMNHLHPMEFQPPKISPKKRKTEDAMKPVEKPGFDLTNNIFLVVNSFEGSIRIHIRKYVLTSTKYIPTKEGISFSPATFRKFLVECYAIGIREETHLFNGEMLLTTFIPRETFQFNFQKVVRNDANFLRFFGKGFSLNASQFDHLRRFKTDIVDAMKQELFGDLFKTAVWTNRRVTTSQEPSPCQEADLILTLLSVLQYKVEEKMYELFNCPQCQAQNFEGNQLAHECVTTSKQDLTQRYFQEAVLSIKPQDLGKTFAVEAGEIPISETFLGTLNAKRLLKRVKEMINEQY